MHRNAGLMCATTCFLGNAPRYLRDHRMLTRALREQNQPPTPAGTSGDEETHLRKEEPRPPFRGRGGGGQRGRGAPWRGGDRGRGSGAPWRGGGGDRGGGRGYGSAGGGGGDGPPKWPCVCGAQNFSNRVACYRCNVPKPPTSNSGTPE